MIVRSIGGQVQGLGDKGLEGGSTGCNDAKVDLCRCAERDPRVIGRKVSARGGGSMIDCFLQGIVAERVVVDLRF